MGLEEQGKSLYRQLTNFPPTSPNINHHSLLGVSQTRHQPVGLKEMGAAYTVN